jgi:hypothetical protein
VNKILFVHRLGWLRSVEVFDGPNTFDTLQSGQVIASVSRLDFDGDTIEHVELVTNIKRKIDFDVEEDAGSRIIEAILELWKKLHWEVDE